MARVQVCFYVFSDQTSGRQVTLYPLTRPFREGTGGAVAMNLVDGAVAILTKVATFAEAAVATADK